MKSFTITEKNSGRHVIRVITGEFPSMSLIALRHALKDRDIRVNGRRIREDVPVSEGDEVAVYLPDDVLEGRALRDAAKPAGSPGGSREGSRGAAGETSRQAGRPQYKVIYSDDNIIVVSKSPGIPVHSGEGVTAVTLIDRVRGDFGDSGIQLCHRIDMNTGGLVLLARNERAVREIGAAIRSGLLYKRYRCLVRGRPAEGRPVVCADKTKMFELRAYHERGGADNEVYIHDEERSGDTEIVTRYRILNRFDGAGPGGESVSELEVELSSGRMHQIRAHLAHLGHPLLGDGRYGRNAYNRHFRTADGGYLRHQQLWATSIHFLKLPDNSALAYLSGRVFKGSADFDIRF